MRRCLSPFICTIFNHFTSTTFKIKISSMGTYEIILYLIVGGIIGFFLGRLAFKSKFSSYLAVLEEKSSAKDLRIQELQDTISSLNAQIGELQNRLQAEMQTRAAAEERAARVPELNTQTLLRNETANLVKALGTPKVRGKWGELQLRRVVELAGMVNYCDFTEQVAINAEEGRLIPDLIVHLPGGRDIVIDAKTPLGAYLEAISEVDEEKRKKMLEHHARQIREHMDKLSKKSYWQQFTNVPEFVVLFLPGEIFFSAALEQDPSLIEYGVDQKIIIATPTTLIALLKAVAYGWKQQSLAENAQRISELGTELYSRLISMSEHLAKLGSSLESAVKSYNNAIGSFETRVLVQARKFKELGASKGDREIESLIDIEVSPRQLRAEENHNK